MAAKNKKNNTTILVAPLDWGLGHATRCIPIIKYLLQKQCRVIVATSGLHQILLQQEFGHLEFIHLDGYGITYAKKHVLLRLALQLPKFMNTVNKENDWLQKVVETYKIDGVISDNRYGLYTNKVPAVFITHQLQLKVPRLFCWIKGLVRKRMYRLINHFSACWVPDAVLANESLAGTLSHPTVLPAIPVKYIGWLTRFDSAITIEKKYTATISLSGPEPQRSLLEAIIIPQLEKIPGNFLIIRGMPGHASLPTLPKNSIAVNHLNAADMQKAFLQSSYIVGRSGYSTLMDMKVLQCKCIFIPTPGQTEQEYLGECLAAKNIAIVKQQSNFSLADALHEASIFPFASDIEYKNTLLEDVIDKWLISLQNRQ